jgi:hypothetical protein
MQLITIRNLKLKYLLQQSHAPLDQCTSFSINEHKLDSLIRVEVGSAQIVTCANNHLARIYPAGLRVGSTNYTPQMAWNVGCQLVALNMQTHDAPVWLNQAKFSDNGGCGWVLKPSCFLEMQPEGANGSSPSLPAWLQPYQKKNSKRNLEIQPNKVQQTLVLTVISGHYLPKPNGSPKGQIIDPYVRAVLSGAPEDSMEYKTRSVENNGFNPEWGERVEFPLTYPQLATLMLVVEENLYDGKQQFIGQYGVPVSCLRPGFRVVPLKNKAGSPEDWAYIFCHVQLS